MVRTLGVKQEALAKARARRLALDADRDVRDRRVEAAAAEVFVLLAERAEAERAVIAADTAIGAALRRLLAEGIAIDGVSTIGRAGSSSRFGGWPGLDRPSNGCSGN